MRRNFLVCSSLIAMLISATVQAGDTKLDPKMIERGRYISQIGGCNDCHTPGYFENGGTTPIQQWLTGDAFGWSGPWGTTYAPNLRIYLKDKSEDEWVKDAKTLQRRPPMPWFNVNAMHEQDLRALYQFVKSFKDLGEQAPAYLPPDKEPPMPFAKFPAPPPEKK